MTSSDSLVVVGAWHLGLITGACMAESGCHVTIWDGDSAVIHGLNSGHLPLFEPGLDQLVAEQHASGRLTFTSDLEAAVRNARWVWLAMDTPLDDHDRVDLSSLITAVTRIGRELRANATVIISSQVPVGTCDALLAQIHDAMPDRPFGMCYIPENLRLGRGISRFRQPDMLVLGVDHDATVVHVEALLAPIAAPRVVTTLRTAEMTKHAINAFLATSISFANEVGNVCDVVGADAHTVARALRLDERIGPQARLAPGLGFAGGTLARDLRTLQAIGDKNDYDTVLVDAVLEVNTRQNRWMSSTLRRQIGSLTGARIAILGLTYTPETSTLRRSAAIELAQELAAAGCHLRLHDPHATDEEAYNRTGTHVERDPYAAVVDADAVVVMTAWPQFRDLNFPRLLGVMARPLVLDPQGVLDGDAVTKAGGHWIRIGTPRTADATEKR